MFFPTNHIILNLRRTIMRRENIFRKIKRIISQFIETEYWYRFRKLPSYWYDDEQNIYSPLKEKILARDWQSKLWIGNTYTTSRIYKAHSRNKILSSWKKTCSYPVITSPASYKKYSEN